jgi:hypothetical protein
MKSLSDRTFGAGHLQVFALLLLALAPLAGHTANIRAEIDRNPVRMGETITLTYSADGDVDDPDLSPLQNDFEVLGTGTSQQVSMANGGVSRLEQWEISLTPKRPGTLPIPSVRFGDSQSPALSITVEDAPRSTAASATGEAMFLELDVQPRNPYVQSQVIFTVRLLRKIEFINADLSEPSVPDALVQRIEEGRTYVTERGGARYRAVERKYAIFPQKSGLLHIPPVALNAQVVRGGGGFNSFFAPPTQPVHLVSDAVDLDVRPVPAAFTGKHWLPAESLQLQESWSKDPPRTGIGEPITRTLTVHAVGATVGVLPELGPGSVQNGGDAIKPYLDQPNLKEVKTPSGLASTRQEKAALIPSRAGTYTTAELQIPWWNTRSDKPEVLRLPPRQLIVDPATGEIQPPTASPAPATEPSATTLPSPPSPIELPPPSNEWRWIALTLVVGWTATLAAWFLSRRRQPAADASARARAPKPNLRQIVKSLQKACETDNAATASSALLDWAKITWQDLPGNNLRAVATRVTPELAEEIRKLDRLVYGPNPSASWDGTGLWKAFQAGQSAKDGEAQKKKAALEPLHRIGEK